MQTFVGGLFGMFGIPRRCPVDDAPHTTCTSPDYVPPTIPGALAVVPIQRPFVLDATLAALPPPPAAVAPTAVPSTVVSEPFTTATYRRPRKGIRR